MKQGYFCKKHEEYAASGECRWCEPKPAPVPEPHAAQVVIPNMNWAAYYQQVQQNIQAGLQTNSFFIDQQAYQQWQQLPGGNIGLINQQATFTTSPLIISVKAFE